MLSLAAPLWLLGWLSLPLIRWLHRFSVGDKTVMVSALFLWPPPSLAAATGRKPATPDPRWRLRALIVALLMLVLAGPTLEKTGQRTIDVWVDDSLSMQTVENGQRRLQTAFDQLDGALLKTGATRVQLHSLLNPAVQIAWRADTIHHGRERWPDSVLSAGARPRPPIASLMNRDHEHWLITDGADSALDAWADTAPLSRILQSGEAGDNAAVTLLSARPDLEEDGAAQVLLTVHNLGAKASTRTLSVYVGDALRYRESLRIPPHSGRDIRFRLPISDAVPSLRATLTPADALAADDTLNLSTSGLSPLSVVMDGDCPAPFKTAMESHPRIRINETPRARHDMRVVCNNASGREVAGPTLRIHPQHSPQPVSQSPSWSAAEQPMDWPLLQPEWLYADANVPLPGQSKLLFGTAENPLITASETTPRVIDVFLDLAKPILVHQPEYLALIDGLITSTVGRPLLDESYSAERSVAESRIAPQPLATALTHGSVLHSPPEQTDLSPLLVLLAALLLVVDLVLVRRTARAPLGYNGV
jgi:hypothetical protein